MSRVVALGVSYQAAKPSPDYTRLGKVSTPAYIWGKLGSSDAITDIEVLYDDEAPSEGFTKIDTDLNKGKADAAVYLSYIRGDKDLPPIVDLKVIDSEDAAGEGYKRVEKDLNRSGRAQKFLCYKTEGPSEEIEYVIGMTVDVLDSIQKWCVGDIVKTRPGEVYVHYRGWSDKWNEWVKTDGVRLAPLRTYTTGDTGAQTKDPMEIWRCEGNNYEQFLKHHKRLKEILVHRTEGNRSLQEQAFLVERLPNMIVNVLKASVDDPKRITQLVEFLIDTLDLVLVTLQKDDEVPSIFFKFVIWIFGTVDERFVRFYQKYGTSKDEASQDGKFCTRKTATRNRAELMSVYLVQMINHFGEHGGFEAMLKRAVGKKTDDDLEPIALGTLSFVVRVMSYSHDMLEVAFIREFYPRVKDAMFSRLEGLTDSELKTLDKDSLQIIITDTCKLLGQVSKNADQACEEFRLKMVIRLLKCPSLERRINGISDLREIIESVEKKEQHSYSYSHSHPPPAKYLSAKLLLKWITEQDLVKMLLLTNSHVQLISRTPAIFRFMAKYKGLTADHLNMLWDASQDKHESIVRAIYEAIIQMMNVKGRELTVAHVDVLQARIEEVPIADYNELTLQFIHWFTFQAIQMSSEKRGSDPKMYGLELMWQVIVDDSPLSEELVANAQNFLIEQLREHDCFREKFIMRCIANLKSDASVCQSVYILQEVIRHFPEFRRHRGRELTQENVITQLLKKRDLLDLLYTGLKKYRDAALAALPKVASPANIDQRVLVGRHPHAAQVDTRLQFLQYVYRMSDQPLDKESFDTLWDTLVTNPVSKLKDCDLLMQWLRTLQQQSKTSLTPEVSLYIFQEYLSDARKLNYEDMTPLMYACFETFCRQVNAHDKRIEGAHSQDFLILKYPLIGLDSLWEICANVRNNNVFIPAASLLRGFHVKLLDPYNADADEGVDRQAVTKAFLDRSNMLLSSYMAEVKRLKPGPEKDIKRRSIIRILDIVERFVANMDEFMMRTTFHGHQLQVHLITVVKKKEKISRHQFDLKDRDLPLVEIRNSIAKHWKCDPRVVRLESNGRILYPSDCDDCNCQELYVADPLVARRLTEEDAIIDAGKRTEQFEVRYILSNTAKHFELLFSLLDLGSDIAERVWKLLNSLPHNQALQKAVLDHDAWPAKPDFATMFFVSSPPKLLYTLRVVWDILENDPKEWLERFLGAGGFKFLYEVFMGFDQDAMFSNDLTVQCLRTVLFHIVWIVQHDTSHLHKYANLTKLTKRLLDCIHRSATYAMDAKPSRASDKEGTPRGGRGRRHKYGAAGDMDEKDERYFEDDRYPRRGRFDRHRNTPPSSHRAQPPEVSIHGEVVAECVRLLRICLDLGSAEQLKIVFEFPQLNDVIMSGLLKNSGQHLREELAKGITALCEIETPHKGKRVLDVMISALLGCLFQIDTRSPYCLEYFSLIQDLLSGSIDTSSLDTASIIPQIVKKIREHPIIERRANDNDYVLRGLLTLCSALIDQKSLEIIRKSSDESLIREIFINCLFKLPNSKARIQPPKCKSKETRRAAFNLLIKLVKDSPLQLRELLQLMIPYHGRSKAAITAKDWEFLSVHEEKSETGYVGLKNLGCICYMNSFFQQIFMMPQLRKDILAVQDTSENKSESVLYQLQHILGFLQESEKQYCDPSGFCHAFKDFEGNPTNVSVQMDANEFVNFLFDRIDTLLKDTPHDKVLQKHMGGQLVQQVIGKTCPHTSERFEPFYLLTLHIRNKKNIKESLEAFVEGDMLEGDNAYQCSKCDKKVDAVKRSCLGKLPPTLVLHLSRFEFDFDAMAKVKLNDRCEFPIELDMRPYTAEGLAEKEKKADGKNADAASDESSGLASPPSKKSKSSKDKTPKKGTPRKSGAEGKDGGGDAKSEDDDKEDVSHPDSYYKYRLVGVLVHMGSANGGHYYSFIKERQGGVGGTGGGRSNEDLGVWNEYNDIHVHPFDPRTLADETFGGEEVYAHMGTAHEKRRNAYMLFYERVEQDLDDDSDVEGKELKDEKEESAVDSAPSRSSNKQQTSSKEVTFYGAAATAKAAKQIKSISDQVQSRKVPVPPEIFNEIWEENISYWRNMWVFNLEYFKFVNNIMKSLTLEEDRSLPLTSLPDPRVSLDMAAAQLLTRFVLETYSRSHFKDDPRHQGDAAAKVDVWTKKLRQVYKSSTPACIWLLEELADPGNFWLKSLIIDQRNEALRSAVTRLVVQVIEVVLPLEAESRGDNPLLFEPVRTTPRPQVKATALNASAVHSDSSSDEYVVVEHSDVDDTAPRVPLTYRVMVRLFSHIHDAYPVWDRFHHYFEIFSKYAQSGPAQARRLLDLGVVRHFVDFWLADASPQQTYVKPRLNSRGMRRRHGDSYNRADFHFLLRCLSYVVRSASVSKATLTATSSASTLFHESHPSLATSTPSAGAASPPAPEMGDADRDMVLHDRNRDKMLAECINQAHGNSISAIICHFCWEDLEYTETLVAQMIHLIEETDAVHIRRYFRVLTPMLALEDSLQETRVDLILSQLLAIMETQRGYYRATEMCVEHVIRIARQNDVARQWLSVAEHAEQLSWMIDYFKKYTRPPTYNDNAVRLNKHREHDWRSGHAQRVYGLPADDKVAFLEALQEGRDDLAELSDADTEPDYSERTFEKGQEVDCLDQVKKWCKARVIDVNKDDNQVFLHYDGWNDKWDEWIDCDSERLIEAGRRVPREEPASDKKGGGGGSSVSSGDSPAKSSAGDSRPRSPLPQGSVSSVSSTNSSSTTSRPTSAQKGAESGGGASQKSAAARPQSAPSRTGSGSQIADKGAGKPPMNSKQKLVKGAAAAVEPQAHAVAAADADQGAAAANSPRTPKSGNTDKENAGGKKSGGSSGGSRRSSSRSGSKNEKKKSKSRTQGDSGSTQPSRGFRGMFSKNK